jgi:hypothetical protein
VFRSFGAFVYAWYFDGEHNTAGEKEGPMGLSAFRLMMHHGIAHKRSLLFMVGM